MTTAITFDAYGTGTSSWSHTSAATAGLGIVVTVSGTWNSTPSCSGATWNSVAMTQIGSAHSFNIANNTDGSYYNYTATAWMIAVPASGAKTVAVSWSTGYVGSSSATYKNCRAPTSGFSALGYSSPVTLSSIYVPPGGLLVDACGHNANGGGGDISPASGQTSRGESTYNAYWERRTSIADRDIQGSGLSTSWNCSGPSQCGVFAIGAMPVPAAGSATYFWFKKWNAEWKTWKERQSGLATPDLGGILLPGPRRAVT